MISLTTKVHLDVVEERNRQDTKWGEQNHHAIEWLSILGEEVGEAFKGANEAHWGGKSYENYRAEMIQVAAVAIAAVECLDRNSK